MKKGFTLIEIVVVMAILTVALVSFMPKVTSFLATKETDPNLKLLDDLTQKAFMKAQQSHCPIAIWGIKGSNHIFYAHTQYQLADDVFDVRVNGHYQTGLKYYFLIYPDGLMDKVKITFANDKKVYSLPLLLRWKNEGL